MVVVDSYNGDALFELDINDEGSQSEDGESDSDLDSNDEDGEWDSNDEGGQSDSEFSVIDLTKSDDDDDMPATPKILNSEPVEEDGDFDAVSIAEYASEQFIRTHHPHKKCTDMDIDRCVGELLATGYGQQNTLSILDKASILELQSVSTVSGTEQVAETDLESMRRKESVTKAVVAGVEATSEEFAPIGDKVTPDQIRVAPVDVMSAWEPEVCVEISNEVVVGSAVLQEDLSELIPLSNTFPREMQNHTVSQHMLSYQRKRSAMAQEFG